MSIKIDRDHNQPFNQDYLSVKPMYIQKSSTGKDLEFSC